VADVCCDKALGRGESAVDRDRVFRTDPLRPFPGFCGDIAARVVGYSRSVYTVLLAVDCVLGCFVKTNCMEYAAASMTILMCVWVDGWCLVVA
jgi:hypothetical protein